MSRMKIRAALALMLALLCAAGCAAGENAMRVYVSEDAMGEEAAVQMIGRLCARFSDTAWVRTKEEKELRTLVLGDCAPNLAICSPEEARRWAEEGLLLPLQLHIGGQKRIPKQMLDACVMDEWLFMAPLQAKHRKMAVNADLFEQMHLSHMLDTMEYPAWYPAQMQQIMEELMFSDVTAFEIWPPETGDSTALEAMVQAIFVGSFAAENGERWRLDREEIRMGVDWLCDLLECGMIGMAENREDALERFVCGETAIFIDWSDEVAAEQKAALAKSGVEIAVVSYPSSSGVPVRSCEVVGVCAFDSGNAARNAMAMQAARRLYEEAQALPGSCGMYHDDSIWLPCLSAHEQGETVRSLFGKALGRVLAGEATAQDALALAQATIDAMP